MHSHACSFAEAHECAGDSDTSILSLLIAVSSDSACRMWPKLVRCVILKSLCEIHCDEALKPLHSSLAL